MTFSQNPFASSPSLPAMNVLNRRRKELLNQARNQTETQPPQAAGISSAPLVSEDCRPQKPDLIDETTADTHELEVSHEESHEPDPAANAEPPLPHPASTPLTLAEAALYGFAGVVVRSLEPHTEADPAALLLQFLAAFGNLVGPAPHCLVGAARHGLNLFVVLVGESSKARKGTSWRQIAGLFSEVDLNWATDRVSTTRPTANIIASALRDQPTESDRRLFLLSEEFASVLHLLGRETGQLSPLLRCAWDGGAPRAHHQTGQTAAHISLVGHVTQSELALHLNRNEAHNGFANRCLWTSVARSKSLPEGSTLHPQQQAALARELRQTLDWARDQKELVFSRTPAARELWNDRYATLSQGRQDAYGAATSRAEAQVLRLSAIYAALDRSSLVEACHLHAALAVWDYCLASARLFFDNAPIDPTARRIIQAIDVTPQGLTRGDIRALFHRHVSKERIDVALEQLMSLGLIYHESSPGRGRSSTLWVKTGAAVAANPDA